MLFASGKYIALHTFTLSSILKILVWFIVICYIQKIFEATQLPEVPNEV